MKKFSLALAAAAFAWLQPQAAAQTRPFVEVVPCPSEATLLPLDNATSHD